MADDYDSMSSSPAFRPPPIGVGGRPAMDREEVIVKGGHRVVVVEFDKEGGDGNTKVYNPFFSTGFIAATAVLRYRRRRHLHLYHSTGFLHLHRFERIRELEIELPTGDLRLEKRRLGRCQGHRCLFFGLMGTTALSQLCRLRHF